MPWFSSFYIDSTGTQSLYTRHIFVYLILEINWFENNIRDFDCVNEWIWYWYEHSNEERRNHYIYGTEEFHVCLFLTNCFLSSAHGWLHEQDSELNQVLKNIRLHDVYCELLLMLTSGTSYILIFLCFSWWNTQCWYLYAFWRKLTRSCSQGTAPDCTYTKHEDVSNEALGTSLRWPFQGINNRNWQVHKGSQIHAEYGHTVLWGVTWWSESHYRLSAERKRNNYKSKL